MVKTDQVEGKELRIYLDSCCFNRPFDDLNQDRIYYEAIAILAIIKKSIKSDYVLLGSDFLVFEISRTKDERKRENMFELYSFIDDFVEYNDEIALRARELRHFTNIGLFDSLHLASAEYGKADVFLTTDDKLIKKSNLISFSMRIMNPVSYIVESI